MSAARRRRVSGRFALLRPVFTLQSPASIQYLDAVRATDAARVYKHRALARLAIERGARVLDVGCGPGDDIREIARTIGSGGRAVGVDCDYQMIAEAWRRQDAVPPENVEFRLADAHALPFADGTFDACRGDRVFQHLTDPALALREMMRVARSGASLVVSEPDWETLTIDATDRAITRRIIHFIADRSVRHGWIGRQLPRLFKEQDLSDVHVESAVITVTSFDIADRLWGLSRSAALCRHEGAITAAEEAGWLGGLQEASQVSRFFGAQLGFIVSGRKR